MWAPRYLSRYPGGKRKCVNLPVDEGRKALGTSGA